MGYSRKPTRGQPPVVTSAGLWVGVFISGALCPVSSQTLHRNRCTRRISIMNPEPDLSFNTADSIEASSEGRYRRILDMTAALRTIFGDAAVAIADGQPGTFDVGGRSGIRWQDLADELRAAKLPRTATFTPTP